MVDTSNLKVGDVVHVRMEIENINDTVLPVGVRYGPITFRPSKGDIVHVEPRPLKIGDVVTWGLKAVKYTIRFIDDDGQAFLRCGPLTEVEHIDRLERADG